MNIYIKAYAIWIQKSGWLPMKISKLCPQPACEFDLNIIIQGVRYTKT